MQAAVVQAETQKLAQVAEIERQRLAAIAMQVCDFSHGNAHVLRKSKKSRQRSKK